MKSPKIITQTIRDQVYDILKDHVMNGEYRAGEKISEQAVADQLKVSRSPVREAINQLVSEGLLEYHTNRGAHVKKYTGKNVSDSFAVRLLLEQYAVTHIKEDIRENLMKDMQKLHDKVSRADRSDYLVIDTEVHRMIIRLCGNEALLRMYDTLYSQISAFQEISQIDDKVFAESTRAHLAILGDLVKGEDSRALNVITKHLVEGESRVKSYLMSQETAED